jgi:hypothetical protein
VKPYDTLITTKYFKEDKKFDMSVIKEEDKIVINIHGTRHHKTKFHLAQQILVRPMAL